MVVLAGGRLALGRYQVTVGSIARSRRRRGVVRAAGASLFAAVIGGGGTRAFGRRTGIQ